jgi:hypothetical protein
VQREKESVMSEQNNGTPEKVTGTIGHFVEANQGTDSGPVKALTGYASEPIIYCGELCATCEMIDEMHGRPKGTTSRTFNSNREPHFLIGKHYHEVPYGEIVKGLNENTENVFSKQGGYRGPRILFNERGYLMIVKSFRDARAWAIYAEVVDGYFRHERPVTLSPPIMTLSPAREALSIIEGMHKLALAAVESEENTRRNTQQLVVHGGQLQSLLDQQPKTKAAIADADQKAVHADQVANHADGLAKAALAANTNNHGYFTVLAFVRLLGREISLRESQEHGKKLTAICKQSGTKMGKMCDPRFGKVNTYPESVLEGYFGESVKW